MNDTTSHQKVNPTNFMVESGEPTLIKISDPVEQASVLLNRDNRGLWQRPQGRERLFPRDGPARRPPTTCRYDWFPRSTIGPIKRHVPDRSQRGAIGPQEFQINNGQEEDTIRELTTSLTLEPGQVAVIGCRPEQKRGLGTFFFTQTVAHSDQRMEKLILIWASRNLQGMGPNDRNRRQKIAPRSSNAWSAPPPPRNPSRPTPAMPRVPGVNAPISESRKPASPSRRSAINRAVSPPTRPPVGGRKLCTRKPEPDVANRSSVGDCLHFDMGPLQRRCRSQGARMSSPRAAIATKSSWTARAARAAARSSAPR